LRHSVGAAGDVSKTFSAEHFHTIMLMTSTDVRRRDCDALLLHAASSLTVSNAQFPSESRVVWFWSIMRRLGVPPSPAVIQIVMDELTQAGAAQLALSTFDEHRARTSGAPTLGLLHSVMRAHIALRHIEAVIKTYGQIFEHGLTPQSEADALLVRALLQNASMREMAFTTYHKKLGVSALRVSEAQSSGVLALLLDACVHLDATRAAAELKKLCAFPQALTEHEYTAAINACRHHGFREQELAFWRERHSLARSGARGTAQPSEDAVRRHYG
jgi:hypothetical protein